MSEERKPKYQIGDKVRLNVGGPDMAVHSIIEERTGFGKFSGSYRCQWFAGKKSDKDSFPEESLVLIVEEQKEGSTPSA